MALSKEETIIRLRRGIASAETSPALKAIMEKDLEELLNPPAEPAIIPDRKPKKVHKPKPKKEKKVKVVEPIIETVPERVFTAEEKEAKKAEYAARRAKKKEKENQ